MRFKLYQIDAFASRVFEGNPAAVCPLDAWLSDELMQSIAAENNLAETAFFVARDGGYSIRWFTPVQEVKLCGHATLASAYVLFNILGVESDKIDFDSKSGTLSVSREDDWLVLDFPAQPPVTCETPAEIVQAFGLIPRECLKNEDYVVILENEEAVHGAAPNLGLLEKLSGRGVIISALSEEFDFVARFFAPSFGIPEDPVTGSAYTQLVPYWAQRLGKNRFHAKQVSQRGGELRCELSDDRVLIAGKAIKYLEGVVEIEEELDHG